MEEYVNKRDLMKMFYTEPPDAHYASYYIGRISGLPTITFDVGAVAASKKVEKNRPSRADVVHDAMEKSVASNRTSCFSPTEDLLGNIAQAVMELSVSVAMLVDLVGSGKG